MPQPQVGKQRQQATEKAKTGLIATPKYGAGDLHPTHFRLPEKRDRIMKPIILKLICAAIAATALAAVPNIDAHDPYLQPAAQNTASEPTSAEIIAAKDLQAEAAAAAAAKQYEEMTVYEIMRGVVYEPEGGK